MKNSQFFLFYFFLMLAQVLICAFLDLSQYVVLSILPMLVMCIPIIFDTWAIVIIAFVTGFLVDFLSTGMLGETSIALMVVAFIRNPLLLALYGDEILTRRDGVPLSRQGGLKIFLTLLLFTAVYFLIFVWVDAAGTRPFWFNLVRWLSSTVASSLVALVTMDLLFTEKGI